MTRAPQCVSTSARSSILSSVSTGALVRLSVASGEPGGGSLNRIPPPLRDRRVAVAEEPGENVGLRAGSPGVAAPAGRANHMATGDAGARAPPAKVHPAGGLDRAALRTRQDDAGAGQR